MIPRAISLVVVLRALSILAGEALSMAGDLRHAQALDPFSFDIAQAQVEILFHMNRLEEAVLISRRARGLFPGSVPARAAYAAALMMQAVHGGGNYTEAKEECKAAWRLDPASPSAIERLMFLAAAGGRDLAWFRALGMRRAELTANRPLDMTCHLCGKPWLKHQKSGASLGSRPKS